jgi:ribosome-binding factor A
LYLCLMESTRQNKIARLIQKDLGTIFRESASSYDGAMITVTKVYVTSDLSIAKAYLSIFATPDKEAVLQRVRSHAKELRHHLGKLEGKQLRIIPELQFFEDDSLDYIDRIETLLKS